MPYKLRKAPNQDAYWVVAQDGRHLSKKPLPLERAKAQMRAVYAAEAGYTMRGGFLLNDSGDYIAKPVESAKGDSNVQNASRGFRALAHVAEKEGDEKVQKGVEPNYDYYDALGARVIAEDFREAYTGEKPDDAHLKAIRTVVGKAIKHGGARFGDENFYKSFFSTPDEEKARISKLNATLTRFPAIKDEITYRPIRFLGAQLLKEDLEDATKNGPAIDKKKTLFEQSPKIYEYWSDLGKHEYSKKEVRDLRKKVDAVLEKGIKEDDDLYATITRNDPIDKILKYWEEKKKEAEAISAAEAERIRREDERKKREAEQEAKKEKPKEKTPEELKAEEEAFNESQKIIALENATTLKAAKLRDLKEMKTIINKDYDYAINNYIPELLGRVDEMTKKGVIRAKLIPKLTEDTIPDIIKKYNMITENIASKGDADDFVKVIRYIEENFLPKLKEIIGVIDSAIEYIESTPVIPQRWSSAEVKSKFDVARGPIYHINLLEYLNNANTESIKLRNAIGSLIFNQNQLNIGREKLFRMYEEQEVAELRAAGKEKQARLLEARQAINIEARAASVQEEIDKFKKQIMRQEKVVERIWADFDEKIKLLPGYIKEFAALGLSKEGKGQLVGAGNAYEGDFNHKTYSGPAKLCGTGRVNHYRKLMEARARQMK